MNSDIRRTLKQAELCLGRLKTQRAWRELDEAEGPGIAGLRKGPKIGPSALDTEAGQFWQLCTTLYSRTRTLPPAQRRPPDPQANGSIHVSQWERSFAGVRGRKGKLAATTLSRWITLLPAGLKLVAVGSRPLQ